MTPDELCGHKLPLSGSAATDAHSWELYVGRSDAHRIKIAHDTPTIQTMTTTAASDVCTTVEQLVACRKAGADIIRVTVPTLHDAAALQEVMHQFTAGAAMPQMGYTVCPVVADIHFSPQTALEAAKYADAVRINPGNYLQQETPKNETEERQAQLNILQKVGVLITECKKNNVVIRIGVNHGSLAPRIVEKYGAGLEGMVQSAMEFLEVCRHFHFERHVVVSLKASDVKQMVFANRLLVRTLHNNGFYNKLHLGVTEAGAGEDGRIKSAIGIGTLLADGIGDTLRVSLTENPIHEVAFGRILLRHLKQLAPYTPQTSIELDPHFTYCTPPQIQERIVPPSLHEFRKGLVLAVHRTTTLTEDDLHTYGFIKKNAIWQHDHHSVDLILCEHSIAPHTIPHELYAHLLFKEDDVTYTAKDGNTRAAIIPLSIESRDGMTAFCTAHPADLYIIREENFGIKRARHLANLLYTISPQKSTIFWQTRHQTLSGETLQAAMGVDYGAVLLDDFGNGVVAEGIPFAAAKRNAFSLLQSLGLRRVNAEFVGCPGCGRTLFDLESTFENVKQATAHLRHLKIAVMGCIVNGPGEMGDADYGYVGAGQGKITLYKAGKIAKRNIATAQAIDELIALIKESGDWYEA